MTFQTSEQDCHSEATPTYPDSCFKGDFLADDVEALDKLFPAWEDVEWPSSLAFHG